LLLSKNSYHNISGIFRNNYAKHCKSPEQESELGHDGVTRIDLCIIQLERAGQVKIILID